LALFIIALSIIYTVISIKVVFSKSKSSLDL
jgi:hypothetical protein